MKITFNIVYTPGTVSALNFMVHSLLQWSDCSFRLVSNHCLPPERRFLSALCRGNSRLEFYALPTKTIWPHDQVLNYLQALTHEDFFAFLDSDIFASGEFLSDFVGQLSRNAGIFSCAPLWARTEDEVIPQDFQLLNGSYNRTDTGVHIGSTYFAIYDNRVVTDFISNTGIGFDTCLWDEIPPSFRDALNKNGLAKQTYDTAKLLNCLLVTQGHSLCCTSSTALTHIGGTSFIALRPHRRGNRWTNLPIFKYLQRLRSSHMLKASLTSGNRKITDAELEAEIVIRLSHRNVVREYFWSLSQALQLQQPLPPLPQIENPEIQRKFSQGVESYIAVYQEFSARRGSSPASG